jgi:hypothetical protein
MTAFPVREHGRRSRFYLIYAAGTGTSPVAPKCIAL